MVANTLELFVFTYNRAEFLARTLGQLADSPFRACAITILDNHSTDSTPHVCGTWAGQLPRLRTVRHPKNIGGLANYLRAIELASAEYTWVLCDDDRFDFGKVDDILALLGTKAWDLISVGVEGHELPGGYRGTVRPLALAHPYFLSHSFVPSLIFRTDLFDEDLIRQGYANIETMFPHFPFVTAMAEQNRSIALSRDKVIRKSVNVGYSTFRFLTGWIQSCRKIPSPDLRRKALAEVLGRTLATNLLYCILTERTFRPGRYQAEYRALLAQAWLAGPVSASKIASFAPLVWMPAAGHRAAWRQYQKHRQRQGLPLPNFDEER